MTALHPKARGSMPRPTEGSTAADTTNGNRRVANLFVACRGLPHHAGFARRRPVCAVGRPGPPLPAAVRIGRPIVMVAIVSSVLALVAVILLGSLVGSF
jgi:hypothetical protein